MYVPYILTMNSENAKLFASFAMKTLNHTKSSLQINKKCLHCFLNLEYCVCSQIKSLFLKSSFKCKLDIDIFMHYKEWGRSSNTGKILSIGIPDNSNQLIYGNEKDSEKLLYRLSTKPSLILYPSISSQSIIHYRSWFEEQKENVNICVIDSTWSLSQSMNKSLPHTIPRVNINDIVSSPSLFLSRKQSLTKTKISTIEAISMAIHGIDKSYNPVSDPFIESLKYCVNASRLQAGKGAIYDICMDNNPIIYP